MDHSGSTARAPGTAAAGRVWQVSCGDQAGPTIAQRTLRRRCSVRIMTLFGGWYGGALGAVLVGGAVAIGILLVVAVRNLYRDSH